VHYAKGTYIGVVMDHHDVGKNNGTSAGITVNVVQRVMYSLPRFSAWRRYGEGR
jgi:hypothetical protein